MATQVSCGLKAVGDERIILSIQELPSHSRGVEWLLFQHETEELG
jgi:hypothetical protein